MSNHRFTVPGTVCMYGLFTEHGRLRLQTVLIFYYICSQGASGELVILRYVYHQNAWYEAIFFISTYLLNIPKERVSSLYLPRTKSAPSLCRAFFPTQKDQSQIKLCLKPDASQNN
jgi:hypothetical protein